ncbi:MAG: hypothetical protein ACI8UO_006468, partial [Verrucomicrobiales bacterium]
CVPVLKAKTLFRMIRLPAGKNMFHLLSLVALDFDASIF